MLRTSIKFDTTNALSLLGVFVFSMAEVLLILNSVSRYQGDQDKLPGTLGKSVLKWSNDRPVDFQSANILYSGRLIMTGRKGRARPGLLQTKYKKESKPQIHKWTRHNKTTNRFCLTRADSDSTNKHTARTWAERLGRPDFEYLIN